jgi:hypothetical protein
MMKMPDYPRMAGLQHPPVEDEDTIVVTKPNGFTMERHYGVERRRQKYLWKNYSLVGTIYDQRDTEGLIAKSKKYYAALGLAVRIIKHSAHSYGQYWDVYVGSGKWHEGVR